VKHPLPRGPYYSVRNPIIALNVSFKTTTFAEISILSTYVLTQFQLEQTTYIGCPIFCLVTLVVARLWRIESDHVGRLRWVG
jgi:hypothetical protein